jgi:penicillin-binding protein 1C
MTNWQIFNAKKYLKTIIILIIVLIIFLSGFWFLPKPLFNKSHSSVLFSSNGELLSAKIATDEQWRFPEIDSLPPKLSKAIITFEDEYFYQHLGVNPISIVKAFRSNFKHNRKKRGGSTITMQLVRLALGNPKRTYWQKIKEIYFAILIDIKYSKNEILKMYLSYAPMGGNIVGVSAASWRYYKRSPYDLSWAESCLLAVLPNAPGLLYPGVRAEQLERKRNFLLDKIYNLGYISKEDLQLAKQEKIPLAAPLIEQKSFHFLNYLEQLYGKGKVFHSSINENIQEMVLYKATRFSEQYQNNYVNNISVVVMDIEKMEVLAYIGNILQTRNDSENYVDIAQAKRSTGSTLKPFLYGMTLTDGTKIKTSLLYDIPISYRGFRPQNYSKKFLGLVSFQDALTQSLNLPSVTLLGEYGIARFKDELKKIGFHSINQSAQHYGLSLILGGAECSLFDLTAAYALLANSVFNEKAFKGTVKLGNNLNTYNSFQLPSSISLYSAYQILEILSNVSRPREEDGWKLFGGSKKIAWKTGTSFGHRDAWAVGVNGKYAVGVWVGNATGEGKTGLTGTVYAGPVLFSIFNALNNFAWFKIPKTKLQNFTICKKTGYLANEDSPETTEMFLPVNTQNLPIQNFYKRFWLDEKGEFRVFKDCYTGNTKLSSPYLNINALAAYYYKMNAMGYTNIPPLHPMCYTSENSINVDYPSKNSRVKIPINIEGEKEFMIIQAHTLQNTKLYWHLNNEFLGETQQPHQQSIQPSPGKNQLVLVDEFGNQLDIPFVVDK